MTEPDQKSPDGAIKRIYVLVHKYEFSPDPDDPEYTDTEMKELYYSLSSAACEAQIPFYASLPGFRDYPDGFKVMHIDLDSRGWETGFIRV